MTKPRNQGGFILTQPYWQGIALLARWASKLLAEMRLERTQLFLSNLITVLWTHQWTFKRNNYMIFYKLLFGHPKSFDKYIYTKGLWAVWGKLRQFLQFNISEAYLLAHWLIKDALCTLPINKVHSYKTKTSASSFNIQQARSQECCKPME